MVKNKIPRKVLGIHCIFMFVVIFCDILGFDLYFNGAHKDRGNGFPSEDRIHKKSGKFFHPKKKNDKPRGGGGAWERRMKNLSSAGGHIIIGEGGRKIALKRVRNGGGKWCNPNSSKSEQIMEEEEEESYGSDSFEEDGEDSENSEEMEEYGIVEEEEFFGVPSKNDQLEEAEEESIEEEEEMRGREEEEEEEEDEMRSSLTFSPIPSSFVDSSIIGVRREEVVGSKKNKKKKIEGHISHVSTSHLHHHPIPSLLLPSSFSHQQQHQQLPSPPSIRDEMEGERGDDRGKVVDVGDQPNRLRERLLQRIAGMGEDELKSLD